jgi:putative transposase
MNGSSPSIRLSVSDPTWYYDNPKGNAETERMVRTIKEEVIWLNEFSSLEEAKEKMGHWINVDYHKLYPHSKLGYLSPEEFEAEYLRQDSLREGA